MFKLSYSLRLRRIPRLRDLKTRAWRNLETRIQQNVVPRVEQDVIALLAPYPGPAVYPFEFATDKSRRFYFWRFKDRIPYQRTGAFGAAWSVVVNGQVGGGLFGLLAGFITARPQTGRITLDILNESDAAQYVYGPRQVPGHANTGWGELIEANGPQMLDRAASYVVDEWPGAVVEAIEEN